MAREKKYEKVKDEIIAPEAYENFFDRYLAEFCEDLKIEDPSQMSQGRWTAAMIYINKKFIAPGNILKNRNTFGKDKSLHYAPYNIPLVERLCDIYIYKCNVYEKEVSTYGFSLLAGMDEKTLFENWGRGKMSNPAVLGIVEKLTKGREESLSAKLATGQRNPVGVIAILNHYYSWASPYVAPTRAATATTPAEIAAKYGLKLSQKDTQIQSPAAIIDAEIVPKSDTI